MDIIYSYVFYEDDYHHMIGWKYLSPYEAYKEFHNFLKKINIIGFFKRSVATKFGSAAQNYKDYFITKVMLVKSYTDARNYGTRWKRNYRWYEDLALLFPFLFEDGDDVCHLDPYWRTVYDLWLEYCSSEKLLHSELTGELDEKYIARMSKILIQSNFFRE